MLQNYSESLRLALKASKAYYEDDKPIISDSAYDALVRELKEYEDQHPNEKSPISPTTTVGGKATSSFAKVQFPVKMLSLKNAFTDEEVLHFMDTAKELNRGFIVQPKLDGLTLVLWYDDGFLVRAATRGNGEVGEDVTLNAVSIIGIPTTIYDKDPLVVRGEVVMHLKDFEALNKDRAAKGKPLYANARNVAAGSVRQKDASITASRKLHFYAYDCPGATDYTTEAEMLAHLTELGFHTPRSYTVSVESETLGKDLVDAVRKIKVNEKSFPFAMDGAVIKTLSRGACRTKLGEGTHDPNWAIAFKFTPVSAITKLLNVTWQIGRTGKLTPVAELEPVDLCGTTVTHASLHNIDYVRELQPHIGDMVSVFKAAEIIPQIDCVVESMNGDPVTYPALCPECGAELVQEGPNLMCPNPDCTAKIKAEIRYFVARQNLDIMGVGPAIVEELVDSGRVHSPADLYKLTRKSVMTPGLIALNKAQMIVEEIERSKEQPFYRVLSAIGIDMVSITTAKQLADTFESMEAINNASEWQLANLDGLGVASAKIIYASLHSARKQALIQALTEAGLQMVQVKDEPAGDQLKGKTICITGTLSKSRDEFKKLIESYGGKVSGAISSNTDYLLAGEGGGSKRAKAEKLEIPIINEQQLKEMLE